jgi:hypothetical protein
MSVVLLGTGILASLLLALLIARLALTGFLFSMARAAGSRERAVTPRGWVLCVGCWLLGVRCRASGFWRQVTGLGS